MTKHPTSEIFGSAWRTPTVRGKAYVDAANRVRRLQELAGGVCRTFAGGIEQYLAYTDLHTPDGVRSK